MAPLSNIRQEKFVQGLFEGKSATQAYADAGYKPHQGNSSRLRWYETVQGRLAELQEAACKNSEITVESLMQELEDLRAKAVSCEQYAAGVRAVSEKIKLSGLAAPERIEVKQTDFDETMSPEEILAKVAQEAGPRAAMFMSLAFGADPKQYGIEIREIGGKDLIGQIGEIGGKDPEIRHVGLDAKTFKPVAPNCSQRAITEWRPPRPNRKREIG